jgi:hypothetical protein
MKTDGKECGTTDCFFWDSMFEFSCSCTQQNEPPIDTCTDFTERVAKREKLIEEE